MIDRIEGLLERVETVPLAAIIDARWNFARQILTHLDHEDALVFLPLSADSRPAAVETAALFHAERDGLAERFRAHARQYWREETIDADRTGYATGLLHKLAAVRDIMRREEALLYPLADDTEASAGPIGDRWTADAWRYRAAAPAAR